MATILLDSYRLKNGKGVVSLSITIGYAQLGATSVSLNGQPFLKPAVSQNGKPVLPDKDGNYPGSFALELDENQNLVGKQLSVVASVSRIQPDKEWTSLTVALSGGVEAQLYPVLKEKIAAVGGWLTYVAIIDLTGD